jgi:hypothetical protein
MLAKSWDHSQMRYGLVGIIGIPVERIRFFAAVERAADVVLRRTLTLVRSRRSLGYELEVVRPESVKPCCPIDFVGSIDGYVNAGAYNAIADFVTPRRVCNGSARHTTMLRRGSEARPAGNRQHRSHQ